MPPLTWQTVAAPNLGRAAEIMNQAAANFTNAGAELNAGISGIEDARDNAASTRGLEILAGVSDPSQVAGALARIRSEVPTQRMNAALLEAMGKIQANSALTNATNSSTRRQNEDHEWDMGSRRENAQLGALMAGTLGDAARQAQSALHPDSEFSRYIPGIMAGEGGGNPDAMWSPVAGQFSGFVPSQATAAEWMEFQKPGGAYGKAVAATNNGVFATPLGDFQIVGETFREFFPKLGLPENTVMTREVQARVAEEIYRQQGINAWGGYRSDPNLEAALRTSKYQTPASVGTLMSQGRDEFADVLADSSANEDFIKARRKAERDEALTNQTLEMLLGASQDSAALTEEQFRVLAQNQPGVKVSDREVIDAAVSRFLGGAAGLNAPADGFTLSPELTEGKDNIAAGVAQVSANAAFDSKTSTMLRATENVDMAGEGVSILEDLRAGNTIKDTDGSIFNWSESDNDALGKIEAVAEELGVSKEVVAGVAKYATKTGWFDSVTLDVDELKKAVGAYGSREDFLNMTESQRRQQLRMENANEIQSQYEDVLQQLSALSGRNQESPLVRAEMVDLQNQAVVLRQQMESLVKEDADIHRSPEDQELLDEENTQKQKADLVRAASQRSAREAELVNRALLTAGAAGQSRQSGPEGNAARGSAGSQPPLSPPTRIREPGNAASVDSVRLGEMGQQALGQLMQGMSGGKPVSQEKAGEATAFLYNPRIQEELQKDPALAEEAFRDPVGFMEKWKSGKIPKLRSISR